MHSVCSLNCAATSRQDVVVRHDVDDSSEEQKHRRQWDDQDVGHLLSVLDNAELSSSCSASQTSCSESVSQTSCVTDDAVDAAAVSCHSPDSQVKDTAETSAERRMQTSVEAEDESSDCNDASSTSLTQTPTCHKTLTPAAAADAAHGKSRKSHTMSNADDKDDNSDDRSDIPADDDYTDADEDEQVSIYILKTSFLCAFVKVKVKVNVDLYSALS